MPPFASKLAPTGRGRRDAFVGASLLAKPFGGSMTFSGKLYASTDALRDFRLPALAFLRGAALRFFFQGAPLPGGFGGPLMVRRRSRQRSTCLLIQADCLATNSSRLISPLCTMSSACSQIAVVPGSAIARGTASIRLKAAGLADSALPCLLR